MPVKFETITFNIKDVIMIIGGVCSIFGFIIRIESRFDAFELKMQKIVSDAEINRVEFNAKIEDLRRADNTPNTKILTPISMAIIPDTKLAIKRKKLFQHKLI